jgi:hypothetical protein
MCNLFRRHPNAIPSPLGNAEMVGVCPRRCISRGEICRSAQPKTSKFILFEEFQIALPLKRIGIILRAD